MFCISFDFPDYSDLLDSPKSFDFTDCSCLCARHIYSFTRYVLVNRQWGLSTNDPGMGGTVFHYPVTFNPFIALAGATKLGAGNASANDAVVTELGTTSCTIDSTPVAYTGAYRVVVIGRG